MELSATEVRILGALVEKQKTTPDVYPLSLNALTNACNQTSNRDPVMDLSEDAVKWAVNNLRQQSLVRAIQPADSRVMKFQHLLAEKLRVEGAELAVLCVLMLRGPQTIGEIKTRTGRLHEFGALSEVEAALRALAQQSLAAELPRRAGQKEVRYAHLLSPLPDQTATAEAIQPAVVVKEVPDAADDRIHTLETTVEQLRTEIANLQSRFEDFMRQFG
jgi:uncharacterized protein YceH (UPF0502 family)